jgi:hypothetical protein
MTYKSPITVSFPLGLFNSATMNVPPADAIEEKPITLPMDRELIDMPNIIPETEGADKYFYFDDVSG